MFIAFQYLHLRQGKIYLNDSKRHFLVLFDIKILILNVFFFFFFLIHGLNCSLSLGINMTQVFTITTMWPKSVKEFITCRSPTGHFGLVILMSYTTWCWRYFWKWASGSETLMCGQVTHHIIIISEPLAVSYLHTLRLKLGYSIILSVQHVAHEAVLFFFTSLHHSCLFLGVGCWNRTKIKYV